MLLPNAWMRVLSPMVSCARSYACLLHTKRTRFASRITSLNVASLGNGDGRHIFQAYSQSGQPHRGSASEVRKAFRSESISSDATYRSVTTFAILCSRDANSYSIQASCFNRHRCAVHKTREVSSWFPGGQMVSVALYAFP